MARHASAIKYVDVGMNSSLLFAGARGRARKAFICREATTRHYRNDAKCTSTYENRIIVVAEEVEAPPARRPAC